MRTEDVERSIKDLHDTISVEVKQRILSDTLQALKQSQETPAVPQPNIWGIIMKNPITKIAAAASFLIVLSWAVSFVLYREVADLRDELELARRYIAVAPIDDSVTINFYLREHQDFIARQASLNSVTPQPAQIRVSQRDIMYYEHFDDRPEYMRPGIIVRGPLSQREIGSSESQVISNGHILTSSEVKEAVDFDLVFPSWLHPGYMLDQIRRIEGRDALHLLYTDGANTLSLFEQPLDGQQGLSQHDFREYAVYQNDGQIGGAILTWRDDALTYVLIGNTELSQLMDIANLISAIK